MHAHTTPSVSPPDVVARTAARTVSVAPKAGDDECDAATAASATTTEPRSSNMKKIVVNSHNNRPASGVIRRVSFSARARQISIESKNDMNFEEKQKIWWQPPDYEIFDKTTKILSQSTLTCPNEKHWLCMDNRQKSTSTTTTTPAVPAAVPPTTSSSSPPASPPAVDMEAEHKWWCQFGHSRRGLEHVVSGEEGKHRHLAVRWSRRSVLYEQSRLRKEKHSHHAAAETLRQVSLRCTKWASDLAIASAFSDAHAVSIHSSQEEGGAEQPHKTRESYLLDMVLVQQENKQHNSADNNDTTTTPAAAIHSAVYSSFRKGGRAHIPEFIKLSLRQQEVWQQAAAASAVRHWNHLSNSTATTTTTARLVEEQDSQTSHTSAHKRQRISNGNNNDHHP